MKGSCLCGAVRYRLEGSFLGINYCHCRQCRKASGTAFATNGALPVTDFMLDSGADVLRAYESSPGKRRHFCGVCGSPIYSHADASPDVLYLRVGTLDDEEAIRPDVHIHVASMARWHTIGDDLPRREAQEDLWF